MTGRPTCEQCGVRCDMCDERMCAEFGPEPAPRCSSHPTCLSCAEPPTCRDCVHEMREATEGTDW